MNKTSIQRPGVIFDGDDTLWQTIPLYRRAKFRFCALIKTEGFESSSILQLLENIDIENTKRMGFSRKRFPFSMIQVYRFLCKKRKVQPKRKIENAINCIANEVFSQSVVPVIGVQRFLSSLRSRYTLVLATKGDNKVQRMRLDQVHLRPLFDFIYVLDNKHSAAFRRIIRECKLNVKHSWAIGDSVRSDINPALNAGLKAIWLRSKTWGYETEKPIRSKRLFVVNCLPDAINLILGV